MKNPSDSQVLITKLLQRVAGEYGTIGLSFGDGGSNHDRWFLKRSYRRNDPMAFENVDLGDSLLSSLGKLSHIMKDPPPGDIHGPKPSPGLRPWTRRKT